MIMPAVQAALEPGASGTRAAPVQIRGAGDPRSSSPVCLGPERRRDATVYRLAVQPHRAGAAIACVATLTF